MREILESFFRTPPSNCGSISNERSLQLELGIFLRQSGYSVDFELPLKAERLAASTIKPKYNLDMLLISPNGERTGIELKVPLNGQHPETIYAFCADIEFLEAIKRSEIIDSGCAIMLTHDQAFWRDSGRGSPIHNMFRQANGKLTGLICKPTGSKDTFVQLEREYHVSARWFDVQGLLPKGRCVLVDI
jgi:hypothetical protein